MKMHLTPRGYYIYTGQRNYKDLLEVTEVLTEEDISELAEEELYKNFLAKLQEILDRKDRRYNSSKIISILIDGVYSIKKGRVLGLTIKRRSFNARLTRMLQNYEMAHTLGIECHLKNKLLEKENDTYEARILGL